MGSDERGTQGGEARRRPQQATVVAWLALFVALGGAASGLPGANSVGPDDIRFGAVRSPEIHDGKVKRPDLGPKAVTTPAVADAAVTPPKLGPTPAARVDTPQQSPGCASQVVEDNQGETVEFSIEAFDTQGLHVAPPADCAAGAQSRLTAPVDGLYSVNGEIDWPTDPDGRRFTTLSKTDVGGSVDVANSSAPALAGSATQQNVSTLVALQTGDYVEMRVSQTAGNDLTLSSSIDTYLTMAWIGPPPQ